MAAWPPRRIATEKGQFEQKEIENEKKFDPPVASTHSICYKFKMKLSVSQLASALFVLAPCCSAGLSWGLAGDELRNLELAAKESNYNIPDEFGSGEMHPVFAWNDDLMPFEDLGTHLNKPNGRFAHLGDSDDYALYGIDWQLKLPVHEQPEDHMFVFALNYINGHFAPLGFVRYASNGVPHSPGAFWMASEELRRTYTVEQMQALNGFPPKPFNGVRAPGT